MSAKFWGSGQSAKKPALSLVAPSMPNGQDEDEPAPSSRAEIIEALVKKGAGRSRAAMYADCFIEYRDASAQITRMGTIVANNGRAVPNPHIAIRDGAWKKLQTMRDVKADFLWR